MKKCSGASVPAAISCENSSLLRTSGGPERQIFPLLGIDPSIEHTGIGLIEKDGGLIHSDVRIMKADLGESRLKLLALWFQEVLQTYDVGGAVVEWPTFQNSPKGKRFWKGGMNKLAAATGVLISLLSIYHVPFVLATPHEWKGKYTKPAIRSRVETLTGKTSWKREDEWEALGLAYWARKRADVLCWH